MYNKKAKFLSILCATALVCQGIPVSAEEVSIKEEATQGVSVTAVVEPEYAVTIPKSLTLDKEGVINYTVTATGEIEKLSTLTVTPDESFVLTTRYDSAIATVSQKKIAWSDTDLATDSEKTTTGSITVDGGLAPGDWAGTINFEIALNEHVHEYETSGASAGHTCSICNTSREHVYSETIVAATCANAGTKTYTCECGYSYSESIPTSGHTDADSDGVCDDCSKSTAGLYDESGVMTASWDELLDSGTITVAGGKLSKGSDAATSLAGKLVIDSSVTSIEGYAFSNCTSLTSITIPDSVTSLGTYAFSNCESLTSVDIPDGVTRIGNSAFSGCSKLTSMTIPDSVTSIGENAFSSCSSITNLGIPAGITKIGTRAFSGCSSLESIIVDSKNTVYDSRNNCNAIIETATNTLIAGCKNTIISDSVTSIGNYAFQSCKNLTSVVIPSSITSIGAQAFYECSGLTSIEIPDSVASIGDDAFEYCSSLTSITIPSSVTSIGNYAFAYCSSLASIDIPSSITSIGRNTFAFCSSLASANIPDSVTSIGGYAFRDCRDLTSITIPDSVTSINAGTFLRCSKLTSITIPSSMTSIGDSAFQECSSLTSIDIPASVTSIGSNAFEFCNSLTSVDIPASVTSIGNRAFEKCNGLTSITIPSSVTSIGVGVFDHCGGLESIAVDNGNTVYDSRNDCNAIIETATNTLIYGCKNTIIPDDVTSIGTYAFSGCSSLTSIDIPDNVTSIGEYAFFDCDNLASVVIPDSVTSLGQWAFCGCGSFTINYKGTEEQWNAITKGFSWAHNSTPTLVYNYTE